MTKTIGLITTGQCEHQALAPSLQRVFAEADVEFISLFRDPTPALTTGHLDYPAPVSTTAPTHIDKFVGRMAAQIFARNAPDFVFAIDDLELANIATPANVTRLMHDAAVRALGTVPVHDQIARLQTRCSFHLLCPMVEAYFFGEPAALVRAGARRPPILLESKQLEAFETADIGYEGPPDEARHDWRTPDRHRHPKRYLRFLADPGEYRETRGGHAALATLDWSQVFAYPPPEIAFARSLFDDLAHALGVPNPFPGPIHPLTAFKTGGALRNL
ncbi:MAG TPA: hypothetical protein VFA31_01835 [Candidatus Polarisedimenticolia bacterium]|nr:hypothetical protein [Candidatus Polarisedimenticolia bacterium]